MRGRDLRPQASPPLEARDRGQGLRAAKRGTTSVAFAIAWLIRNELVSAAIAGPGTEGQWTSYLPALDVEIGEEDETIVDSLVPPGHPSMLGYSDPVYPVEGRPIA